MRTTIVIAVGVGLILALVWGFLLAGRIGGATGPESMTPEEINQMSDQWREDNEALIRQIAQETGRPLFEDLSFMEESEVDCPIPPVGQYTRCD
jgi:hypothetical protein